MFNFLQMFKKSRMTAGTPQANDQFQQKYAYFQLLLSGNNQALEIMAELEELCYGLRPFSLEDVAAKTEHLVKVIYDIAEDLNALGNGKYPGLYDVVENIGVQVLGELVKKRRIEPTRLTIPFPELSLANEAEAGGKAANLGEVSNRAHLPTPRGFAVTAYAAYDFLKKNGIFEFADKTFAELDVNDTEELVYRSEAVQGRVLQAELPPPLEKELRRRVAELVQHLGPQVRLAVRSSATSEDAEASFAGQHSSELNVPPDRILDAYKRVVASTFTPRAVFYRRSRGYPDDHVIMSVLCLNMVDAKCSGVMYTRDPNDATRNRILVNAVRGLGIGAVEGSVEADYYELDKSDNSIVVSTVADKLTHYALDPLLGLTAMAVPPELCSISCLDVGQITSLGVYGQVLESHYGHPVDVEWAMDRDNRLVILQARPLRISMLQDESGGQGRDGTARTLPLDNPEHPVLVRGGVTAARGKAFGPAYIIKSDHNLLGIPEGTILIAPQTSPRFVSVLGRVRAIVAEVGSVTGHLATVAREFDVPTLVDVKGATRLIAPGELITVDASNRVIYRGEVKEILERRRSVNPMKGSPVYKVTQEAMKRISPLNLTDPEREDFTPSGCRTLHDVIRFAHEMSMREMFQLGDDLESCFSAPVNIPLPMRLYAVDLGGALPTRDGAVEAKDVASAPFQALLKGMLHEKVNWVGHIGLNVRGFASILAESAMRQEEHESLGGPSYLAVSTEYMNFNSRLGYHFATIDAYCGPVMNDNYITFSFKGGAADIGRRSRRAMLIKEVLKRLGFATRVKGDMVRGTLKKYDQEVTARTLDMLGRLLGAVRLLDMVLSDDGVIDWYVEEFFKGNYTFSREEG